MRADILAFYIGSLGPRDMRVCNIQKRPLRQMWGGLGGFDNPGSFVQTPVRSHTMLYFGDSYSVFEF